MADPADPIAAYLAAVQLRAENVRECPQDASDFLWRSVHSRSARDVPRLLAALDAVLELTVPGEHPALGGMVVSALQIQIRETISRALLGEKADG